MKAIPSLVDKARLQQARVTKDLRDQARQAIGRFVQEVLGPSRQPRVAFRARRTVQRLARALWHEGLIIVYRLLFILKLESSDDPARSFTFASTSLWRNTFSPSMALARYAPGRALRGCRDWRPAGTGSARPVPHVPRGRRVYRAERQAAGRGIVRCRRHARAVAVAVGRAGSGPPAGSAPLDHAEEERRCPGAGPLRAARRGRPGPRLRGPVGIGAGHRHRADVPPPPPEARSGRAHRPGREVPPGQAGRRPGEGQDEGDEPEEEEPEEEDDEDESPKKGKKTTVQWIEEIQPEQVLSPRRPGPQGHRLLLHAAHSSSASWSRKPSGRRWPSGRRQTIPSPAKSSSSRSSIRLAAAGISWSKSCRFLGQHLYEAARLCDEKATAAERRAGIGQAQGRPRGGPGRGPEVPAAGHRPARPRRRTAPLPAQPVGRGRAGGRVAAPGRGPLPPPGRRALPLRRR